jgi:hypothetical protein
MVVQLGAFCASASPEPNAAQTVASDSSVVQRFNMTCFLPVGRPWSEISPFIPAQAGIQGRLL